MARIPEIGEGLRHEADNDGEIYELNLENTFGANLCKEHALEYVSIKHSFREVAGKVSGVARL